MPPRHGKSELTSHWFPLWYLTMHPQNRIILCSYEADFAASWGRKVRSSVLEHGPGLGLSLRSDSKAANRWTLHSGGAMVTAGVRGPITGKGADLVVVDDPTKNFEEAYSPTLRQRTWDWWTSTLRTRLEPDAAIVVVMTRWHESDLVGKLLEQEHDWRELRLPAIAEDEDQLGRQAGEPLWPARYDANALQEIRRDVGELVWAGLYQQRPAPAEGGMVKRAWLRYYDELPKRFDEQLLSWDLSFKGGSDSDFAVGQAWGRAGADCYLLDQVRGRMDFPEQLAAFNSLSARWPQAYRKLVEDAANGAALVASLKRTVPGIVPVPAKGSKEARVAAVSAIFESGNVYLPNPAHRAWVGELVEELVTFPGARNDDQVDATTQALARLSNSAVARLRRLATM